MSANRSRFIENPYEHYGSPESRLLIDQDRDTISSSFEATLTTSIAQLMQRLESNEKRLLSRDDGSIYTGLPGIAYTYYRFGKKSNNQQYIRRAADLIERSLNKWSSSREVTFLTGIAGPLALGAIIHHSHLDREKSNAMISSLRAQATNVLNRSSRLADELLFGRIGYLYALLFVNKHISPPPFDEHFIKQIIEAVLSSGEAFASSTCSESPLMYEWHHKIYLGGAHGIGGILYVLLQAREYLTDSQLHRKIEPALLYLMSLRFPSGNFPSSLESTDDNLVHWCHGAPSMSALFCTAYEVFRKDEYLNVAVQCGEVVWSRGILKKGYGLCHGVAGNAYTFLSLFQLTKDPKHLYRACKFAVWCMDYGKHQDREPDTPFSLLEGLAGTIFFLIDVQEPLAAKFPGYTV